MTWTSFGAFLVAVTLGAMVPGSTTALVINQSAVVGLRAAVPLVVGVEVGLYAWVVASALGVAVVVAANETDVSCGQTLVGWVRPLSGKWSTARSPIRHPVDVDIGTWILIGGAALAVLGGIAGHVLQYRGGDRRPPLDGIEQSGAISE
jgi:hypothetical protein